MFYDYQVVDIESKKLYNQVLSANDFHRLTLDFGYDQYTMEMMHSEIKNNKYQINLANKDVYIGQKAIALKGMLDISDYSRVRLTVNEGFIYGFIELNQRRLYIQPLSDFYQDAPFDKYVSYYQDQTKPDKKEHKCGVDIDEAKRKALKAQAESMADANRLPGACFEVELAIASDFLMFQKYGSIAGVENHNIAVMNDVQTNYDDEFADELQFVIVEQFVSNCSSCDPWSNTSNANSLLNQFTSWAPGGFSNVHDMGQLWTDRDFESGGDFGVIGLAWVGVICTANRYQILEDYTSVAWGLRVLVAHETGHNFDAGHDNSGDPFIMAPAVNNSNTWSGVSISDITSHYLSRNCLAACAAAVPPVADFSFTQLNECVPATVNYTDNSTNDPDSWAWSFPGGSPATSTDQNPVVTYNAPGVYGATLVATNAAGSNSITQNAIIDVIDVPVPDFDMDVTGNFVVFMNSTLYGTSYSWNFGDGNSSTDANPFHTYTEDGSYSVLLTATNSCGSASTVKTVVIATPPTSSFIASPLSGCNPLAVQYTDQSTSNTTSWFWELPGADNETSTDQHPIVVYTQPGVYSATLTATNAQGDDVFMRTDYIEVFATAIPSFTTSSTGTSVSFMNTSLNASSYSWDFGDGNSSTAANPTHTYASGGIYTVVLTATNSECGDESISLDINVSGAPSPDVQTQGPTMGCAVLEVQFLDNSTNDPTAWAWSFPGGSPSTSTDQDPLVSYSSAGTYDVSLTVTNAQGSNTITLSDYIVVEDIPIADFTSSQSGLSFDFINNSADATSYSWDFGDGNTSSLENPSHSYSAEGIYTVVLTATNNCGSSTASAEYDLFTLPVANFEANQTGDCVPVIVDFNDLSSDNVSARQWTFEGGNPSTSTEASPTVEYTVAGTYDVRLVVSNPAGSDTETKVSLVVVDDVPNASFNTQANLLSYNFINTSSNASSYSWNFGDGNTSTVPDPSHDYAMEGMYTVSLMATNACGTDTETFDVNVQNIPTANFTSNIVSGCSPFEVEFENLSSSNATILNWEFEGGTPATSIEENPIISYNTPGVYDVILTVSNGITSGSFTQQNYISVLEKPTAGFNINTFENTINFENTSTTATSVMWDFGDGTTSSEENPEHSFGANGTYRVTQTVSNQCGSDEISIDVIINAFAKAGINIEGANEGCPGFEVTFESNSSMASSLEWTFEGGTPESSTEPNPTIMYNTPGVYDVVLVATNDLGDDVLSLENEIVVNGIPTPSFNYMQDGNNFIFENTSLYANMFTWDFGDGGTSNEVDPMHAYATSGDYTVVLTATGPCGTEVYTETLNIEISTPIIEVGFNADFGCAPRTVEFTDLSQNDPTSWNWVFDGGSPASSSDQNPIVTYENPGVYDIYVEMTNNFGTSVYNVIGAIVVLDVPVAGFDAVINEGTVDFSDNSSYPSTYSWDFGDGIGISDEENPSYTYSESGSYEVTLVVSNICGTDTYSENVQITLSNVDDLQGLTKFELYPNPNRGEFLIEMEGKPEKVIDLTLYTAIGQLIDQRKLEFSNGKLEYIYSNDLTESGTYIVRITSEKFNILRKIIIK